MGIVQNGKRLVVMGALDDRVGVLIGRSDLDSPNSEVVRLEFDTAFKPEVLKYDSELNAAFSVAFDLAGRERAVVAPIVTISTVRHDLFVMASKQIMPIVYNIEPSGVKFMNHNGEISIFAIDPEGPSKVLKWTFFIPKKLNIDIKHLYIPKFDLWISKDRNVLAAARDREIELPQLNPNSIADILVKSAVITERPIHYVFNDLSGTTQVEYVPNQLNTVVSVRVNGDSEIRQFEVDNKEFIELLEDPDRSESVYYLFVQDRLPLMIDFEKERLQSNYRKSKVSTRATVSKEYEKALVDNITGLKKKLYDKEEALTGLENRLKRRDAKLVDLEGKLALLESATRIRQDEFKTRREEVRSESAEKSAKSGEISDTLKVVGAVVGFGVLLLTILHKNQKTSQLAGGLVEWSVPMFGGGGGILSDMAGKVLPVSRLIAVGGSTAISTPVIVGAGCAIVAAVAAVAAVAIFTDKLDPVIEKIKEETEETCCKVKEVVSKSASWAYDTAKALVSTTYGFVKSAASKVASLATSAVSSIAGFITNWW